MNENRSPEMVKRRRRNRLAAMGAVGIALVAFLVITASGIGENLVYYWGPTELREAGKRAVGATIRLGGQVAPGSIVQDGSTLQFRVTDGRNVVAVRSSGVPPQMFREGIGVVVEGTMTDAGVFTSDRLMVSHDNEYRAPDDPAAADTRQLIESTEGI